MFCERLVRVSYISEYRSDCLQSHTIFSCLKTKRTRIIIQSMKLCWSSPDFVLHLNEIKSSSGWLTHRWQSKVLAMVQFTYYDTVYYYKGIARIWNVSNVTIYTTVAATEGILRSFSRAWRNTYRKWSTVNNWTESS